MAIGPKLVMRQSQSLVMTPQLLQAIKLLQLSTAELGAFVEAELERNPMLERAESDDDAPFQRRPAPPAAESREEGDWALEQLPPTGPAWNAILAPISAMPFRMRRRPRLPRHTPIRRPTARSGICARGRRRPASMATTPISKPIWPPAPAWPSICITNWPKPCPRASGG
jgi:hypothetical protein